MKHKYVNKLNITYDTLSTRIRLDSNRNSHTYLIQEFCSQINDRYKKRNIRNLIMDLKNFRNDSDYENMHINELDSKKAYSMSEEILDEIKSY